MRTDAVIILSGFTITGAIALGSAVLGQRLWRRGRRVAVPAWAAGLEYALAALVIWFGPVLGLLLGALIGWLLERRAKGPVA